jgi:LysR family transcriptional regulator, transcriptional activator of nhaA
VQPGFKTPALLLGRCVARLQRPRSEVLYLTPQTISGQLRELEEQLDARPFQKSGRNLVLSDTGRVVFSYADEIFRLDDELQDVLADRIPGAALTLTVGVAW